MPNIFGFSLERRQGDAFALVLTPAKLDPRTVSPSQAALGTRAREPRELGAWTRVFPPSVVDKYIDLRHHYFFRSMTLNPHDGCLRPP